MKTASKITLTIFLTLISQSISSKESIPLQPKSSLNMQALGKQAVVISEEHSEVNNLNYEERADMMLAFCAASISVYETYGMTTEAKSKDAYLHLMDHATNKNDFYDAYKYYLEVNIEEYKNSSRRDWLDGVAHTLCVASGHKLKIEKI